MVMVFNVQDAVTPAGRPVAVPIPETPVAVCVIGVRVSPKHSVGVEEATLTAGAVGLTTIVPVASAGTQPPVSGML